ncbi:MAG: MBL fold metallo-hydrolase [Desulfobacteraceae bacterium]|nr:MBL fold metallo-hydrolase [Desulfobacteraceae bacterium]
MNPMIKEIESVEITTLQDNYIDVLAMDGNDVVQRPFPIKEMPEKGMELSASPIAEHGFSVFVTVTDKGQPRSMLFDFGCSAHGAAYNAELLSIDLTTVSTLALSHGHLDHVGGMKALTGRIGKDNLELVVHPVAFREKRYIKTPTGSKIFFPSFTREDVLGAGLSVKETVSPLKMVEGSVLFLGEIPRITPFEEGMKNAFYDQDGIETPDAIEDDSALVFNIKDKGLVVLSGCAHSGIINTVNYAREVTGVEAVFAVMGGFHLTGPAFSTKIAPTIEALKAFHPEFVVPCHCTGREAVMEIEKKMPGRFLLNMPGTRLRFKQ